MCRICLVMYYSNIHEHKICMHHGWLYTSENFFQLDFQIDFVVLRLLIEDICILLMVLLPALNMLGRKFLQGVKILTRYPSL